MYYLRSENKGAAKLICVFVFTFAKSRISHDAAHLDFSKLQKRANEPRHEKSGFLQM